MSEEDNAALAANNDARPDEGSGEGQAPPTGEDSQSENIQADNIDYEAFAKVQGWAPKEKWRGDEGRWKDAETFVKDGQNMQSTLKATVQRQDRELQDQREANERTLKMFEPISKKAKADALREIRNEQKLALEDEDDKRYDELEGRKTKVYEEFQPQPKARPQQPQEDPAVAQFKADNDWYEKDLLMTQKAQEYCQRINTLPPAEQLKEVKKYMVHEFPDKFENPRRQAAPTVSNAPPPSKVKKTKGWNDIPPADQKMGRGVMKSTGMDQEEYVKSYFEMENL